MNLIDEKVQGVVAMMASTGRPIRPSMVAAYVMADLPISYDEGEGAGEIRVAWFRYLRDRARRRINSMTPSAIDGMTRLQGYYVVEAEDDDTVGVPIELMTDVDLLAKADEYEAMAAGARAHAREIRGYVRARTIEAAA